MYWRFVWQIVKLRDAGEASKAPNDTEKFNQVPSKVVKSEPKWDD